MPDPLPAPSEAATALALALKEVLNHLLPMLAEEPGLQNSRLRGIVDTGRQLLAPLQTTYLEAAGASRLTEEESDALHALFCSIYDKVINRLDKTVTERVPIAVRKRMQACIRAGMELRAEINQWFALPPLHRPVKPTAKPIAVVKVDLVGYESRIDSLRGATHALGEVGLVEVLQLVDQTIREHSVRALRSLGAEFIPGNHLLRIEGDAVVLRFERVGDAVRFADALAEESERHGSASRLSEPFRYRVGMAFGHANASVSSDTATPLLEMSGLPFVWAARMEPGCSPGGMVLHESAWRQLLSEHSLPLDAPVPTEHPFLARFLAQPLLVKGQTYFCFAFAPPSE